MSPKLEEGEVDNELSSPKENWAYLPGNHIHKMLNCIIQVVRVGLNKYIVL